MTITEKAKEKLDDASREIKAAVDGLAEEVTELSERVKEKFKGSGKDMKEVAGALNKEVKELSEKVKQLIPKRRKNRFPRRLGKEQEYHPQTADFPLTEIRREFNRLLVDFSSRFEFPLRFGQGHPLASWDDDRFPWPQMDIHEADYRIVITAELPGVDKDDIEISVDRNRIILRGEKKSKVEEKSHGFYHTERCYGSFRRSIPLPWEVETDRVDAQFNSGVLTVSVPKSAAARIRKLGVAHIR
jgi:HSP20 family protein